jgi:small multidrug resistance pump
VEKEVHTMEPLKPWMRRLLRFVGCYNLLAALTMLVFYHESFKFLGVPKPQLMLPVQLVGILVGLFGVGYLLVASNPIENRNLLTLGFLSKAFGSMLGVGYVVLGKLPPMFLVILIFADIVYLPPFWIIMRRLYAVARNDVSAATGASHSSAGMAPTMSKLPAA